MPAGMSSLTDRLPSLTGKRQKDEDDEDNDFETRVETPLLSDYISVQGNNMVVLRGVGLVTGLNGTGGDPPPSHLRTQLREEMVRRGVEDAGFILKSQNTAMVVVTAYLPPMVRNGQKFDVRVALPPNSNATSLKGGYLLETRLFEEQTVQGRGALKGHEYAVASGAILTALGVKNSVDTKNAMLRRGSIPGGARSKTSRDLEVVLRNDVRSLRNSKRISEVISERFHHYNQYGQREKLADAKTDVLISLKVHPSYRNNFPRYQQVIRSIAFKETEVARRMRLEMLSQEILDPSTASRAALQLEAIGTDAVPFLEPALESDSPEVRFHAAIALAYLGDSSGVPILEQAAADEPAFRVYALAALSVVNDANGVMSLRNLLENESLEARYGAVRALHENSPRDPALGTQTVDGQFILRRIAGDEHPMVHVTRYRSPEISVFGTNQQLRLPVVLSAGHKFRVMGRDGDRTLIVTKYEVGMEPVRRQVSTKLVDVVEALGELGAHYPDIVQLLIEADQQHNLAGELGIDRLPQAGRTYVRNSDSESATVDGKSSSRSRKVGSEALIPDLFDRVDEEQHVEDESESRLASMLASVPQDAELFDPQGSGITDQTAPEIEQIDFDASELSDQPESFTTDESMEEAALPEGIDSLDEPTVEQADFRGTWWQRFGAAVRRPFK